MFGLYDLVVLTIDGDVIASISGAYDTISDFDLSISRDMENLEEVVIFDRWSEKDTRGCLCWYIYELQDSSISDWYETHCHTTGEG